VSRSARQAAFAVFVLVGCSVYDAALLVGGSAPLATAGSGNDTGSGGSANPSAGTSNGASAGKSSAGGRSNGSGGANGGSSSAGRASGSGGSGPEQGGTTGAGGDTSPGGMGEGADAGVGNGGDPGTGTGGGSGTGTGGSGAGAGGTSTAGAGGGSGAATGGTAGSAGTGSGGAATATGCAVLSAGMAASTDKTHYLITLGTADVDFTNAVVTARLNVQGVGGGLFLYVQEATYEFHGGPLTSFSSLSGWTTVTWDLSAETDTSPLDITKVRRLGLEIAGTGGSAWTNPTVVYLDSITVTTPALAFSFDATSSVYKTPTTLYTVDTALWLNNGSSDTSASGSTLDWVASCP
jgi:hypothetical protein